MKTISLYILVLILPFTLWSQDNSVPQKNQSEPLINLVPQFVIGIPIGQFYDKIEEPNLRGKGIAVFYRMKRAPMDVGILWDGFSYGHVRRPYGGNVQKTKGKIWTLAPVVRLEPATGMSFQPYVEGYFGLNRFFTKTYTYNPGERFISFLFEDDLDNRFDTYTLESDWGWALGSGIGAYFVIEKEFYTAIDVQVGFRLSQRGRYLVKNTKAVQVEPIDNYQLEQGALTVISLKVGLSLFGYR